MQLIASLKKNMNVIDLSTIYIQRHSGLNFIYYVFSEFDLANFAKNTESF